MGSRTQPPLLPGPPFVGSYFEIQRDPIGWLVDAHAKHGPAFRYRYMGRRVVALCEPEAREFLVQNGESKFDRRRFFRPFETEIGIDLFSGPREEHVELRSAIRLAFSAEVSRAFLQDIIEIVRTTVAPLREGETIVVHDLVDSLLLRIFARIAANRETDEPHAPIAHFSRSVLRVVMGMRPRVALSEPRYRSARRKAMAFVDDLVAGHRPDDERMDIIDALSQEPIDGDERATPEQLRVCLLYGLMGCLEYVRALVSTMIFQALKNPTLHEQVRQEGAYVLGRETLRGQDIRRMVNTRGLMLESLRMCPPLLGLPFDVTEGFEFAGYWIAPGQVAFVTPVPAQFDPDHYVNPHVFDGGRCQPPRNEHLGDAVYSPFGIKAREHTRHCAAKGFTTVVSIATVASLVSAAELQLTSPSYVPAFMPTPTMGPHESFRVVVGPPRSGHEPIDIRERTFAERVTDQLSDVSAELLEARLAEAEQRSFGPNTVVFEQGDPSDGFYVLLEGHVDVLVADEGRPLRKVATLGPGDFFGEIGLLKDIRRTATIRVSTGKRAEAMFLDRDRFKELVAATDLFSDELAGELHRRYLETSLAAAIPELELGQLRAMLAEFSIREYEKGDVILEQDTPADTFHIVCDGRVRVDRTLPGGKVVELGRIGPGQFFGEIGILQGQRRTASVSAESDHVKTMWIGREEFRRLISDSAGSRSYIARVMHDRIMSNYQREAEEGSGVEADAPAG